MRKLRTFTRPLLFLLLAGLTGGQAAGSFEDTSPASSGVQSDVRSDDGQVHAIFTLSADRVAPGVRARLVIDIDAPRDAAIAWSELSSPSSALRIDDALPPTDVPDGDRRRHLQIYLVDAFAAGTHTLDPVTIEWSVPGDPEQRRLTIVPPPLTVHPAAAPDEIEPRDLKGALDLEIPGTASTRFLWLAAASLALSVMAAILLLLRRGRSAPVAAIAPDDRAMRALDELMADSVIERGEFDIFHERLTHILREYVRERFDLPAPQRTTHEFLRAARVHPQIAPHRALLESVLRASDLVRFAALRPAREACSGAAEDVRRFVRATAPPPQRSTEHDK